VQTNTNSQQKKSSSQTNKYDPSAPNAWWPFDRVPPNVLEKAHKKQPTPDYEEALL
jgi:hypothetical protein